MKQSESGSGARGAGPGVFLYPLVGLLLVGNVVFAILWLVNPLAGGRLGGRGGRRIEAIGPTGAVRVIEGLELEGPDSAHEVHLASTQFEALAKELRTLTQTSRSAEQAREFFESGAGGEAKPALVLSFPRRAGTERLEVYAADARRQLCYCRLARTGEPVAIPLAKFQEIASKLVELTGGVGGSLSIPYYMPLGPEIRRKLQALKGPLVVTTVSSDPRAYLLQQLSNPLAGLGGLKLTKPDAGTIVAAAQLPEDQAMARALADAMARASENVKAQHLDLATNPKAAQQFAQSLRRSLDELQDSLVLQYGDRIRVIQNTQLLRRERTGPLVVGAARFEGEKVVAQALGDLLAERGFVYFAEGHGERRVPDREDAGLSLAAEQLSARGFRPVPIDLSKTASLPRDCKVLVIPGPRKAFDSELEKALADFLARGGRLALFLDPPKGALVLEKVLKRYGIGVPSPEEVLRVRGRFAQPEALELELDRKLDFVRRWARQTAVFFTGCAIAVGQPEEATHCEAFEVARPVALTGKPPCVLAAVRPRRGHRGPKILLGGDVDAFTNQLVRQVPGNASLLVSALAWLAE